MSSIRTPWRCVSAAFALNGILLGTWASRVPAVMDVHDLNKAALGQFLLVMGIGALVSFSVAGRLSDSLGAVRVTRWVALAYLFTLIGIAAAPGLLWFGVALFFFGMAHGSMDVTMNSWATEVEQHMGRSVMSSFHAMWSLGAGLGALSGFVAIAWGWSVVLHFAAVSVVSALLFGPFILADWTSKRRAGQRGDPVFAVPRGALVLVGMIALAAGLGEGAMADWSAVYLQSTVGSSPSQATLGYAVFSVTMVGMRLCIDAVVTRAGPVFVARVSGLAATAGISLVVGLPSLPMALLGFVLMGIGYAALVPLAFSRAAADPHVSPGQGIAAVATLGYGAMMIGPPVIGWVAQATSLRLGFALLGVFAVLVVLIAPVLGRKRA